MRIALVGDLVPPPGAAAGGHDGLWDLTEDADLVFANLEAPLTNLSEPREAKRYLLRAEAGASGLFSARHVVGLANNHILDFGESGLEQTRSTLAARGVPCVGAGRSLEEAMAPWVAEVGEVRVGFLAAADPRYGAAAPDRPGTFPADASLLRDALRSLVTRADLICVTIHMGIEFTRVPSGRMRELADLCLAEGASVVGFHHAHCVSGATNRDRGVILWGMGNFAMPAILPHRFRPWSEGAVWLVDLEAGSRRAQLTGVRPLELDAAGMPRPAGRQVDARIRKTIARWSTRAERAGWGRIALSVASPRYLRLVLSNFLDIARRKGLRACLATQGASLRAHLRGRTR